MAANRVNLTKSNGEQCAIKPSEVAHYHAHGDNVKVTMKDGWVYTVVGTWSEIRDLIDPEKPDEDAVA